MTTFMNDPQFGEIIDFSRLYAPLRESYDALLPEFKMLESLEYATKYLHDEPSYMVAAGASLLAWMMMVAAEEYELAESLKDNMFTLGWTEEHVGSDLLSVRTQATPMSDAPDERQYWVKGRKWLINNSYHADYHMVVAKVDPEQNGPRSLSIFAVPRSSTKNWERLETHVLKNMVLTQFEIDGPGTLVGKPGHGLQIIQRMAMPSKYQCTYMGVRMIQNAVPAAVDHLSTKRIFGNNPIDFSNVFRQMYNLALQTGYLTFLFYRALALSDSSFLQFHGTMLKSFLLLRANELLSQNLLVTGSKGFLKESIIGRDAFDSFILPVFDGHYTINTLMTAKHMDRYINATERGDLPARIDKLRQHLFIGGVGDQINRPPREIRRPAFFDWADYIEQMGLPFEYDAAGTMQRVRELMAELNDRDVMSEPEYKYKVGTLVHWLEAILAAGEFWRVMNDDTYLNAFVMQVNGFVKAFNDIIAEGGLTTDFLQPLRFLPLPPVDDKVAFLNGLVDVRASVEALRTPVAGD